MLFLLLDAEIEFLFGAGTVGVHGTRACEPIVKGAMRLTYYAGETVRMLMNGAWCWGVVEL